MSLSDEIDTLLAGTTGGTESDYLNVAKDLLKRCRQQLTWIPVSEKLPEVGDCVVAAHQYGDGAVNAVCCTYYEFGFPLAMWNVENPVTHWIPLPSCNRKSQEITNPFD
jgi:hypothetical protein